MFRIEEETKPEYIEMLKAEMEKFDKTSLLQPTEEVAL